MDQMKTWFVSNGIIDHFELFTEKGFDSINLVVDYVTEDRLRADFPEISRPGDRFKILQAAEGEKKKRPKSSNDDNSETETNTEVKGLYSQENDRKWKRQRLGFIKNPAGQRAKYYMEIMPAFFEKSRPYVTTDCQFKTEFCQERAR